MRVPTPTKPREVVGNVRHNTRHTPERTVRAVQAAAGRWMQLQVPRVQHNGTGRRGPVGRRPPIV